MELLIVVGLIAFAAYWVGWWVGRSDRHAPWPEAEDCELLSPLERRILPYVGLHDLPDPPPRATRPARPRGVTCLPSVVRHTTTHERHDAEDDEGLSMQTD